VTLYANDGCTMGTSGRAKKRIKDLLADAWGVEACEGGWWIRAPMDQFWQRWIQIDKEWAAQVEWKGRPL